MLQPRLVRLLAGVGGRTAGSNHHCAATTRPRPLAGALAIVLRSVPFSSKSSSGAAKGKKRGRGPPPASQPLNAWEEQALDEEEAALEELLRKDARRRRERADSVSAAMLEDRRRHLRRLRGGEGGEPDPAVLKRIQALGLGRKQTGKDTQRYRQGAKDPGGEKEGGGGGGGGGGGIGAAGFSTYLAASSGGPGEGWPAFKHMLPEVAMAGHSNCGKSSLVNALAGLAPKGGPARVSDRAGWTDAVFFYQLGKKPPVLTLADLPGYGHAVASVQQRRRWRDMTHSYLRERAVLSLCCVLVDCVRGLCREDKDLLRLLKAKAVPTKVVLTKGDLLGAEALAQSHALVASDAAGLGIDLVAWEEDRGVAMVSSGTGAGVTALWKGLVASTRQDAVYRGDIGFHRAGLH